MVNDAEKFKDEDEKQKERVAAKNQLESYAYNMKSTVEDDKLKDKISADDLKTITEKCGEVRDSVWYILRMNLDLIHKRSNSLLYSPAANT